MSKCPDIGTVAGRIIASLAIWFVVGIFIWPGIMGVYNSVVFPGYETCKREISRHLQDSSSFEFDWPPKRVPDQLNPDVWYYSMLMHSMDPDGGSGAMMVKCTVGVPE